MDPSSKTVGESDNWILRSRSIVVVVVVVGRERALWEGPNAFVRAPIKESRRRKVLVFDMVIFQMTFTFKSAVLTFGRTGGVIVII